MKVLATSDDDSGDSAGNSNSDDTGSQPADTLAPASPEGPPDSGAPRRPGRSVRRWMSGRSRRLKAQIMVHLVIRTNRMMVINSTLIQKISLWS